MARNTGPLFARRTAGEQKGSTWLFPIDAEDAPAVRHALKQALADEKRMLVGGKERLPHTHFHRWVVVPAQGSGRAFLAVASCFDGKEKDHLERLIAGYGPEMREVLGYCRLLTSSGPGGLQKAFQRAKIPTQAFYRGHPKLPCQDIQRDQALWEHLRAWIDEAEAQGSLANLSRVECAQKLRERAQSYVLGQEGRGLEVAPRGLPSRERFWLTSAAVLTGTLGLWLPAFLAAMSYLAFKEQLVAMAANKTRLRQWGRQGQSSVRDAVAELEDAFPQNRLTHLVSIRPGPFRWGVLWLVLRVIHLLGRFHYTQGQLGDISTIHFARWAMLPDRRLLFFSNYDGSWESYLGDFVDKESLGLSAVWGHTEAFPPTRLLLLRGAAKESDFKRWSRHAEILTDVWHSAYPQLSVEHVLRNRALRWGLRPGASEDDVGAMLKAF